MSIKVENIHKGFGNFTALGDVSLEFPSGELVGPDGQPLEAELTRDQADALRLQGGQRVKLSAARLSLFEAGAGI